MPNDLTALLAARSKALAAYNLAVDSDGVTASVWRLIAADIDAASDALEGHVGAEALRGTRNRASDARARAQYAQRMIDQVVAQWGRRQLIEVVS